MSHNIAIEDGTSVRLPTAGKYCDRDIVISFKGGEDGTSVTHSWDGTVLTITSASGTTSVDLKGEKGETGLQGIQGEPGSPGKDGEAGKDGYTPVKGKDYYTEEDKQLVIADVLDILKGTAKAAKLGVVVLLADAWVGENNLYSQVVSIEGVTENSQVDLTPDVQQLAIFREKDLAFVTENVDGVVTVYAIGQKPMNDYTVQVTITEVDV